LPFITSWAWDRFLSYNFPKIEDKTFLEGCLIPQSSKKAERHPLISAHYTEPFSGLIIIMFLGTNFVIFFSTFLPDHGNALFR
jgi:hypothetical protein